MKSTSTINPVITEDTECLIVNVRASFIDSKKDVSLDHGVSLCFLLLLAVRTCLATFQAKNNARSAPASSVTRDKAITHILQIVTYVAVEKGMELKGEQR